MKCILGTDCESEDYLHNTQDWEYGTPGSFKFVRCKVCEILQLVPMPTLEELQSYYPPNYHGFHTMGRGIISSLYRIVYNLRFKEYVSYMGPQGTLLDVGCADATYFDLFNKKFPTAVLSGVEFIDAVASKGRQAGRDVKTGILSDLDDKPQFDLIIMNNLIEHVLNPIEELCEAHKRLKPGGHVFVETPNFKSWDFYFFKNIWGGLHVPRHTFLFTEISLRKLAEKTGYILVKARYPLNTDHWALSVQNWLQRTKVFRCEIKKGRVWYYKYLLFAFLPINVIQVLLKRTGSIICVFQKPKG
jgi:SAM-dependent methyltransferase